MVIVDSARCAYCGGCVSVCPEEAITLEETRLVISPHCIDCGNCLSACPMGALLPEGTPPSRAKTTARRRYDMVVVGAGPGGSLAAYTAARAGLSVLLLEKRQEIGSPVRCAEGVGHEQLVPFIEPDRRWISAEVTQAEITACVNGKSQTLRAAGGHGYILERRVFDRALAERAAQAGAEVRVKTAATGLLREGGCMRGLRIQDAGTAPSNHTATEVETSVVVAADGVESQVGRWAGLDTQMPLADAMVCAQYVLAGIDHDPTCTAYTIDYEAAPGGYAWVFPKGDGRANVGLGVQADLWERVAGRWSGDRNRTVLEFLNRFIEARPNLARGYPVTLISGNVPVALPPARMVTGGLMLVGDAARQVDALTGGGIINAMTAGQMAAQVAVEALAARDMSAAFLGRYEERWQQSAGRRLQRNYRLRERFAPENRADERFVRAFALAAS
jgi:digeranylgeranylglycerophospholipid reductase